MQTKGLRGLACCFGLAAVAMTGCHGSETEKPKPDIFVDGPLHDAQLADTTVDAGPPADTVAPKPDTGPTYAWTTETSGVSTDLYGVWGTSATQVLAVGAGGVVLQYDGSGWKALTTGSSADLRGVWGSSATDVHVVGSGAKATSGGVILHHDGSSWTTSHTESSYGLHAVWGSGAKDVVAVGHDGSGGVILRNKGSGWSKDSVTTSDQWQGAAGVSASERYVVGGATVLEDTGSGWVTAQNMGFTIYLRAAHAVEAKYIAIVGKNDVAGGAYVAREDGTWKSATFNGVDLWGVWGTTRKAVTIVGDQKGTGVVVSYDTAKGQYTTPKKVTGKPLYGIWGAATGEMYVVGAKGVILRYALKKKK